MTTKGAKLFTTIAGITSVILFIIVSSLLADAPQINDSEEHILMWLQSNKTLVLSGSYIWGLCIIATFCFLTGLWSILKTKNENTILTSLGLISGFTIFAIALAGFVFLMTAAYRANSITPELAKLLNDFTLISVTLTGLPTAISIGAFTGILFKESIFPKWFSYYSILVIIAHLISGAAFAESGFLSPSGIGVYCAPVLYYVWILLISVFVFLKRNE